MDVHLYTIPGCGYCVKVKELFNRAGIIDYEETVVGGPTMTNGDFKAKFPYVNGFPHTTIDGEEFNGLYPLIKYFDNRGLVSSNK